MTRCCWVGRKIECSTKRCLQYRCIRFIVSYLYLSCITSASLQALPVLEGTTDLKAFPDLEGTTVPKASLVLKVLLGPRALQGQRAHKVQVEGRAAKERQGQKVPQGHQGQETLVHVSTRKRKVLELRQDKAWTRTLLFTRLL